MQDWEKPRKTELYGKLRPLLGRREATLWATRDTGKLQKI